jgi:hypothetical protein
VATRRHSPGETVLYLYGVVTSESPSPPPDLRGIDDAPVRLVPAGSLAAIVSDVGAVAYSQEAIEAGLTDVRWAGERGVEHERVLTWFVDRTTVIPSAPFSLHAGEERVIERLDEHRPRLEEAARRLAGHREMGIRIWRHEEAFAAQLTEHSPPLRQLAGQMEAAAQGRRYLLGKKFEQLRAEESVRMTEQIVRQAAGELRSFAADARSLPIPAAGPADRTRTLVLHAAYLVADAASKDFEATVQQLAGTHRQAGLEWEFTGPWPPYHFVGGA